MKKKRISSSTIVMTTSNLIMFHKKVSNVFTSIIPLYFYLKVCGCFMLSFDGSPQNGILRPNIFNKIWFVLLGAFIMISIVTNIHIRNTWSSPSLLLVVVYSISVILELVIVLVIMIYQCKAQRKIAAILQHFHEFDEEVNLFSSNNSFLIITL